MFDKFNVKNLISIFEERDCFQQDSRHHVTIMIDRKQLDLVIHFTRISSIVLLDNAQIERPKLQLLLEFRLKCLYDRCRIQARKEMISS